MNRTKRNWICLLICLAASAASAALNTFTFNSGFANSGTIPDGDVNGWIDTRSVSGVSGNQITDVTVNLNISGGYNGNLYAYLSYDGTLIPLLNRSGVGSSSGLGYSDAGFNITLSSSAANDVHWYKQQTDPLGGQLTGTWQPDGRAIDPLSTPSSFDSASRVGFSALNGKNPNGDWTLFISDVVFAGGSGSSSISSWELSISSVPEPAHVALAIFGLGAVGLGMGRRVYARLRARRAS